MKKIVLLAVMMICSVSTADLYLNIRIDYGILAMDGGEFIDRDSGTATIILYSAGANGVADSPGGLGGQASGDDTIIASTTYTASGGVYDGYLSGFRWIVQTPYVDNGSVFVRVLQGSGSAGAQVATSAVRSFSDVLVGSPPPVPEDWLIDGGVGLQASYTHLGSSVDYSANVTVLGSGTVNYWSSNSGASSLTNDFWSGGDELTFEAVPGNGWIFSAWSGDLSGTSATTIITAPFNDMSVTATFIESKSDNEDSLVGLYPFNGSAMDLSASENHGTVYGASLTTDRFGNQNSAYQFDGNDYINFGNPEVLRFGGDFTISGWVKHEGGSPNPRWYSHGRDNGIEFGVDTDNWIGNYFVNIGTIGAVTNQDGHQPVFQAPSSNWDHCVIRRHGSEISIFVNGSLAVTNSSINNPSFSTDFELGRKSEYWDGFWIGAIDDVRIYTNAVSDEIISLLYDFIDEDHDGINDEFETSTGIYLSSTNTGTSPTTYDSDGDGLGDGQEIFSYGSDPNKIDTDGDGFSDGFEVTTGYSPLDDSSTPDTLSAIETAIHFQFYSASGGVYSIESTDDLSSAWQSVESNITGNGAAIERFYKITSTNLFYRAVRDDE